jgi:gliding motility-associated-like protein
MVSLSWAASPARNILGYDIYRSADGLTWKLLAHAYTGLSLTDTALNTYGQSYYYKIQPVDSCGNLGLFTNIHKTIRVKATAGNQQVKLDWNAYKGWKVKKYLVYRDGKLIRAVGKDTITVDDTLVICSRMYSYMIKAVCDTLSDTLMAASNTDSVRAFDHIAPQKVYIKTVTVSNPNKEVTLSWIPSVSFDVKNYYVYRKSAATGDMLFIDSTDNTSLIDSRFSKGEITGADCYYVFARDHCGNQSPGSNRGCIMILNARVQPGYNDLDWNGYQVWNDGIQTYNVYKNEDNQGWTMIGTTANGNVNKFTDRNLGDTINSFCYQVEAIENPGQHNQLARSTVVCVHQDATVFIPNTFSHYLIDGLNDKFGPKGLHIKNYTMQVYNRWGEMVYKTSDGKDWDGTFMGQDAQEGVYIYVITIEDYNNKFSTFKGNITVFK